MADDVAMDIDELRHLLTVAKRPRVVSFISSEMNKLEKLMTCSKLPILAQTPVKVDSAPSKSYSAVGSFSWDQGNEKVKIYVSLERVEEEKVSVDFQPMSFDIKFHDVEGKNYRFAVTKLNKEIVPAKSKVMVKPARVVITLVKASKDNWLDLHFKEDKLKPSMDKDKDPMAGIMDLMKNMYEEGDDEMKRTIAKAWTDARSGKGADPMKDYR